MKTLPNSLVTFKVLVVFYLASAIWNTIGDCDETFNYWEPLHFLLYGKGFQTWEYSPVYALRSYTYLWLYGLLGRLLTIFQVPKLFVFFAIRLQCCVVMSLCQTYFYSSMKKRLTDPVIVIFTMLFSCASAGSFISSTAFLPSSFAMYCAYVMLGAWIDKKYKLAVVTVAISAIVGWPFSAALGLPLVFDLIFLQKKVVSCFAISIVAGASITLPMLVIDSLYFGRVVIASLNILKYNVFSAHGSELYGVASPLFYIFNYLLNFNIASCLAFALPITAALSYIITRNAYGVKLCLFASPFFVWNAIFFTQPHKEERFLFPCYPFLGLAAGLSVSHLASIAARLAKFSRVFVITRPLLFLGVLLPFLVLSASRILLIVFSFRAPIPAYMALNNASESFSTICVGKEWHRFPSHFFLRPHQELYFLKSGFKGQLPAKFAPIDHQPASSAVHPHFNDLNKEEPSRYVPIDNCDVIIDKDDAVSSRLEPRFSQLSGFQVVFSAPFSDITAPAGMFKSFYVPLLFKRRNIFVRYLVLKRQFVAA